LTPNSIYYFLTPLIEIPHKNLKENFKITIKPDYPKELSQFKNYKISLDEQAGKEVIQKSNV